jgi:hypothetical protein
MWRHFWVVTAVEQEELSHSALKLPEAKTRERAEASIT